MAIVNCHPDCSCCLTSCIHLHTDIERLKDMLEEEGLNDLYSAQALPCHPKCEHCREEHPEVFMEQTGNPLQLCGRCFAAVPFTTIGDGTYVTLDDHAMIFKDRRKIALRPDEAGGRPLCSGSGKVVRRWSITAEGVPT